MWPTMIGAVGGLVFGVLLSAIAIADAGGGHGFDVFGLYSSPLWLSDNEFTIFGAMPLLWCLLGGLAGSAHHPWARVAFVLLILGHYAGLLPLFLRDEGLFGDAKRAREYPNAVMFALVVYVAGQLALWTLFALTRLTSISAGRIDFFGLGSSTRPTA